MTQHLILPFILLGAILISPTLCFQFEPYDNVVALQSVTNALENGSIDVYVPRSHGLNESRPQPSSNAFPMCFAGEFDVGKTFLVNLLMGTNLPSGRTVSTVGVSIKTHVVEKQRMCALDFAGQGIVLDHEYMDDVRATDNTLIDVFASLPCLPVIVISHKSQANVELVEKMIDRMITLRQNSSDSDVSEPLTLDMVVVVNLRSTEDVAEVLRETHIPLVR